MSEEQVKDKLESRLFMLVIGVCLSLGGWWLQNQWEETRLVNARLADFIKHVDATYVDQRYINLLENKLSRIEDKLDQIIEHNRLQSEARKPTPHRP